MLPVRMTDATTAQCSAPPSDQQTAFLRLSLIPRISRSTVLLSSSIRPSSMKRVSPSVPSSFGVGRLVELG